VVAFPRALPLAAWGLLVGRHRADTGLAGIAPVDTAPGIAHRVEVADIEHFRHEAVADIRHEAVVHRHEEAVVLLGKMSRPHGHVPHGQ